ncbi:MAG: response regulator transcription factor [Thermoanaerobaculia bacterium]
MIRILIVDDHDIVREGLRQIVSETDDISVGGEARTGAEALDKLREGGWDLVILDLNLPDRPGLDVLGQIRALYPRLPVLVLSMHREASYASRALHAGAAGYISKDGTAEQRGDRPVRDRARPAPIGQGTWCFVGESPTGIWLPCVQILGREAHARARPRPYPVGLWKFEPRDMRAAYCSSMTMSRSPARCEST